MHDQFDDETPGPSPDSGAGNLASTLAGAVLLSAEAPRRNYPVPPKGHVLPKCGCRVCTKIKRDYPELLINRALAGQPLQRPEETAGGEPTRGRESLTRPLGPKQKEYIAKWMGLKAVEPDINMRQASERLGIGYRSLVMAVQAAAKQGVLDLHDMMDRLEFRIIPSAMDNLENLLTTGDCVGDKVATLETAKGTFFKKWAASNAAEQTQNTVIALKIEMPEGTPSDPIILGIGTPKAAPTDDDNE